MVVFLITLMPLSYWGIQYLFDQDNVRLTDRILPLFSGVVAAVPLILFSWALDVYFPLSWNSLGIYVYAFFNREGIIIYPLMIFLFLLFRKKSYSGIPLRELTAWFCGFYFMISLSEALVLKGAVSPYSAVLLPLMRLFSLFLLSTLLVRSLHSEGVIKRIYRVIFFLIPLILNFIPVLDILNKKVLFYLFFILFALISTTLYFLESRGDLP